jgi:hypothetical protein
VNDIQEGRKDPFAKHALERGFELVRDTGKHNIWKHSSGAQITSPKTTSDWRSFKNFQAELKSRLSQFGVTSKPVVQAPQAKPIAQPKPSQTSASERSRYSSGEALRTGTQTTFKDFVAKIQQAKEKATPIKATLSARMAAAYDRNQDKIPLAAQLKYRPGMRTSTGVGLADSYVPEQMTAPKIMLPVDFRTTKEKQKEIEIPAKLLPFNPEIGDRYKTSQLAPGKPVLPNARDQVIVDPQSPGQKLRDLQLKIKYYGGYPPKGPA